MRCRVRTGQWAHEAGQVRRRESEWQRGRRGGGGGSSIRRSLAAIGNPGRGSGSKSGARSPDLRPVRARAGNPCLGPRRRSRRAAAWPRPLLAPRPPMDHPEGRRFCARPTRDDRETRSRRSARDRPHSGTGELSGVRRRPVPMGAAGGQVRVVRLEQLARGQFRFCERIDWRPGHAKPRRAASRWKAHRRLLRSIRSSVRSVQGFQARRGARVSARLGRAAPGPSCAKAARAQARPARREVRARVQARARAARSVPRRSDADLGSERSRRPLMDRSGRSRSRGRSRLRRSPISSAAGPWGRFAGNDPSVRGGSLLERRLERWRATGSGRGWRPAARLAGPDSGRPPGVGHGGARDLARRRDPGSAGGRSRRVRKY